MRVIGIIAEYNPFHNGHAYLIQKAKELVGDKRAIVMVVMSGPFTQRGEPALLPKHVRASQALNCGADIVIELPFTFACSPSERFANGAIDLLYRTGVVTDIAFGIDSPNFDLLKKLADIDFDSNPQYCQVLRECLSEGMSFPASRARAIETVFDYIDKDELSDTLHSSNSILALDYLIAIRKHKCKFNIHAIQRIGDEYSSTDLNSSFASATAIRSICSQNRDSIASLANNLIGIMPDESLSQMLGALSGRTCTLCNLDLYANFLINLIQCKDTSLNGIAYMNDNLDSYIRNRINDVRSGEVSYSKLLECLNTKHFTQPRIMRALASFITDQSQVLVSDVKCNYYIRILGFSREGRYCLKIMHKASKLPVFHNCSDYHEIESTLNANAQMMWHLDMRANNIASLLMNMDYNNDYRNSPIQTK